MLRYSFFFVSLFQIFRFKEFRTIIKNSIDNMITIHFRIYKYIIYSLLKKEENNMKKSYFFPIHTHYNMQKKNNLKNEITPSFEIWGGTTVWLHECVWRNRFEYATASNPILRGTQIHCSIQPLFSDKTQQIAVYKKNYLLFYTILAYNERIWDFICRESRWI